MCLLGRGLLLQIMRLSCVTSMRLPDSLKSSLTEHVPDLEKKLSGFAEENKVLLHWLREPAQGTATAPGRGVSGTASGSGARSRTTARPVFEVTDNLIDPNKLLVPGETMNLEEFETTLTILVCIDCPMSRVM